MFFVTVQEEHFAWNEVQVWQISLAQSWSIYEYWSFYQFEESIYYPLVQVLGNVFFKYFQQCSLTRYYGVCLRYQYASPVHQCSLFQRINYWRQNQCDQWHRVQCFEADIFNCRTRLVCSITTHSTRIPRCGLLWRLDRWLKAEPETKICFYLCLTLFQLSNQKNNSLFASFTFWWVDNAWALQSFIIQDVFRTVTDRWKLMYFWRHIIRHCVSLDLFYSLSCMKDSMCQKKPRSGPNLVCNTTNYKR